MDSEDFFPIGGQTPCKQPLTEAESEQMFVEMLADVCNCMGYRIRGATIDRRMPNSPPISYQLNPVSGELYYSKN